MFDDVNRLIEFSVQISLIIGLVGALAAWLKRSVNKGMVTREEFDLAISNEKDGTCLIQKIHKAKVELKAYADKEIVEASKHATEQLSAHKEVSKDQDRADKDWLGKLQDKIEKLQIKVGN